MGEQGAVLAIDIGGSKLQAGIVDAGGTVLCATRRELLGEGYSREKILLALRDAAEELTRLPGYRQPALVGASIPGPCDPVRGVLLGNVSSGLGRWEYRRELGELFGLPVYGDNDVNACAVAEKLFGLCRDVAHFLWITVSYGCGGALYLNDALYRGARYLAGEVGHIPVEFENPSRCGCGILGDLEIEAAGYAIGRKYLQKVGREYVRGFSSREVSRLACAGDAAAVSVFRHAGYHIGRVCAMAQSLLNLECAVLGGGVAVYDFELLEPGILSAVEELTFPLSREGFTVRKTALGYNAALLGAAALALTKT